MGVSCRKNVRVSTDETGKPTETVKEDMQTGTDYFNGVKIANMNGEKWKVFSNNGEKHLVLDDVGDEFTFERHETEPAWKIHFVSDGMKHHVSYKQDATIDANLILEPLQEEDRFYFNLCLQESGRLLIQPILSPGNVVGSRNNNLQVVRGEIKDEDAFVIGSDVKAGDTQASATVRIQIPSESAGILSSGVREAYYIPVGSSDAADCYNWIYSGNRDSCSFQVPPSHIIFTFSPNLYIVKGGDNKGPAFFYGSPASNFQLTVGGGVEVKLKVDNEYMCIDGKYLSTVNDPDLATEWTLLIV